MDSLFEFTSPAMIAVGLVLISWIWEDASLALGAILAADAQISVPLAATSVFLGISSGDLALFYLGRLALRWRRLRAWIVMNSKSRHIGRRFRRSTFTNIIIIRFIPGLRTVGFTLCGLWKVPIRGFLVAMLLSAVLWISLIFTLVYQIGSSVWFENSPWRWSLMSIALFLLIANNLGIRKKGWK